MTPEQRQELIARYLVSGRTQDETKVYYAAALPYRFEMKLRNTFGSHLMTKEAVNCLPREMNSYFNYNSDTPEHFGVTSVKVAVSVAGKVQIAEIQLHTSYFNNKPYTALAVYLGRRFYDIISIDGSDPLSFAPHLAELGFKIKQ